jgi:hypothetical protein
LLREQAADVVALEEVTERAAVEALGARLEVEIAYGEANSEFAMA